MVYNVVKEYPKVIKIYVYKTPYVQREKGYNVSIGKPKQKQVANEMSSHRSQRRSKTIVRDLILCNQFQYFCTFTFSSKKVNRHDISACKAKMSNWLHRQRYHSPKLRYLIVPELHKDGAVHFHALLGNFNGTLKDSTKRTKNKQIIYNLTGYRAGFSTAVPIDTNIEAVASYVTKYITKDMPLIDGRKRYWRSTNMVLPKKTINGQLSDYKRQLLTCKVFESEKYEIFEHPVLK
jgi:hypothetical protein